MEVLAELYDRSGGHAKFAPVAGGDNTILLFTVWRVCARRVELCDDRAQALFYFLERERRVAFARSQECGQLMWHAVTVRFLKRLVGNALEIEGPGFCLPERAVHSYLNALSAVYYLCGLPVEKYLARGVFDPGLVPR